MTIVKAQEPQLQVYPLYKNPFSPPFWNGRTFKTFSQISKVWWPLSISGAIFMQNLYRERVFRGGKDPPFPWGPTRRFSCLGTYSSRQQNARLTCMHSYHFTGEAFLWFSLRSVLTESKMYVKWKGHFFIIMLTKYNKLLMDLHIVSALLFLCCLQEYRKCHLR